MDLTGSSSQAAFDANTPRRIPLDVLQERAKWGGKELTKTQLAGIVFLAWTTVGFFQILPEWDRGLQWYMFIAKMIEAWTWAILTPLLLLIDRSFHLRRLSIIRVVLFFILLSVPFTLVHTYLTGLLLYPIPQITWNPLRESDYTVYFHVGGWVTYCAAVGILEAFRFYSRSERAEKSLLKWRLNALRLHLEPHFLFNALNAISSEVVKRPHLAQDMIADLGALLRLSLDSKDNPEISLAQELSLLDHYLSIQKIRFGKRLDIKIEIDPDAVSAKVPSMLLQPLVENAIRHGVEGRRSGATIAISASKTGNRLRLTVADNGRGLPQEWQLESSSGHGLKVTLERLETLYPECRGECLTISRRAEGGTEVTVRLPFCPRGSDGTIA